MNRASTHSTNKLIRALNWSIEVLSNIEEEVDNVPWHLVTSHGANAQMVRAVIDATLLLDSMASATSIPERRRILQGASEMEKRGITSILMRAIDLDNVQVLHNLRRISLKIPQNRFLIERAKRNGPKSLRYLRKVADSHVVEHLVQG